ncbi:MAG: hypothetical protein HY716_13135 [Planctomycetes bacterium]|nr:hypothetical protein [Planctomycetota bacterium]
MPKLNLALMVVLSLGVAGGAAVLALTQKNADPDEYKIKSLIRLLGDHDPDIQRDAERELRALGPKAAPALQAAAAGTDRLLAERARDLLAHAQAPTPSPEPSAATETTSASPAEAPEEDLELALQAPRYHLKAGEPLAYTVRLRNGADRPYLMARDVVEGSALYGAYAYFEIVDEEGRVSQIPLDSVESLEVGRWVEDVISIEAGEEVDLFAGEIQFLRSPQLDRPGAYQLRFVYEAGEAYRKALGKARAEGVALAVDRLVSNTVTVLVEE